jgi:adenosylcobinamide kinase/adenosylcobinamide-phosphate guanylyltransferase
MPNNSLTLLLGGAGAGKSALAERLAARAGRTVLYVATAMPTDAEMAEKIHRHQAARPPHWRTLEEPYNLPDAIVRAVPGADAVLLDCLTVWVGNLLLRHEDDPSAAQHIFQQTDALLEAWRRSSVPWFVVSNEVGMGVIPEYPLGRAYRDLLGQVNQRVAARATKAYLVVAGLALDLKRLNTPFPTEEEGKGG